MKLSTCSKVASGAGLASRSFTLTAFRKLEHSTICSPRIELARELDSDELSSDSGSRTDFGLLMRGDILECTRHRLGAKLGDLELSLLLTAAAITHTIWPFLNELHRDRSSLHKLEVSHFFRFVAAVESQSVGTPSSRMISLLKAALSTIQRSLFLSRPGLFTQNVTLACVRSCQQRPRMVSSCFPVYCALSCNTPLCALHLKLRLLPGLVQASIGMQRRRRWSGILKLAVCRFTSKWRRRAELLPDLVDHWNSWRAGAFPNPLPSPKPSLQGQFVDSL